jgi:hypothetical protein
MEKSDYYYIATINALLFFAFFTMFFFYEEKAHKVSMLEEENHKLQTQINNLTTELIRSKELYIRTR